MKGDRPVVRPRRLQSDLHKALKSIEESLPPGPRHCLIINHDGSVQKLNKDKHELAEELSIPIRDMRVVDPLVPIPYPSDIMVRERTILINLEAIRLIITKDQVYLLSVPDPTDYEGPNRWVFPTEENYFVQDMRRRISGQGSMDDLRAAANGDKGTPVLKRSMTIEHNMPFEFRVLEGALTGLVHEIGAEISELVDRAVPAMDALIKRVSRHELETMRSVKNNVEGLLTRTQRIRKELETLLDDDDDMAEMYLTRRAAAAEREERFMEERLQSNAELGMSGLDVEPGSSLGSRGVAARSPGAGSGSWLTEHDRAAQERGSVAINPHLIEQCENLLESYLMQVEFLLSRVMLLKESIDDTEDLINIELDQRRNELVSLDLVMTIVACALGLVAAVAGICGMNLSPLPVSDSETPFYGVTLVTCITAVLSMAALLWYAKKKGLLVFIPHP